MSLIGVEPTLRLRGQGEIIAVELLETRTQNLFKKFTKHMRLIADEILEDKKTSIKFTIKTGDQPQEESKRSQRKCAAQVLRYFLEQFKLPQEVLMGLYGALGYNFAEYFEDIHVSSLLAGETERGMDNDSFHFLLFDTFVCFDLMKEQAEVVCYREDRQAASEAAEKIVGVIPCGYPSAQGQAQDAAPTKFTCKNLKPDLTETEFKNLVNIAKDLAKRGELFEVVFSREFRGKCSGSPLDLYQRYREANPAPYLFFFDFGDEQLVGASPEMLTRVEHGKVHLRPISGTRPRSDNPIKDKQYEMELLNCKKEQAELDMLIDLGRNDLRRVCQKGIEITAYRQVERYSKVMHTIAHLTGNLRADMTAFDVLAACHPAGTLSGAPKVQAMREIAKHEVSPRAYYGGAIGYLSLSGGMDTGIIIRTAHIKNGEISVRAGATLLHDSKPDDEYKEIENKARALINLLQK